MTLRQSDDGRWCGTIGVLLTRVVNSETESLLGHSAPFGGVSATITEIVGKHTVHRHYEKPQSWWIAQGWTITEPPFLEEVRRISRGAGS